MGANGPESRDGMHRTLPLAARKAEAEKKKREHERGNRDEERDVGGVGCQVGENW